MKNVSQGKLGHPWLSTFCRPGEQQADHETAMDPHDKKGQCYPGLNEEKVVSRLREVIHPLCSVFLRNLWSAVPIFGLLSTTNI